MKKLDHLEEIVSKKSRYGDRVNMERIPVESSQNEQIPWESSHRGRINGEQSPRKRNLGQNNFDEGISRERQTTVWVADSGEGKIEIVATKEDFNLASMDIRTAFLEGNTLD